jgi:hypothetical protein
MAKTKVSEWSATPANNTDVGGIDINEGCAPSGINNAIRDVMAQIKDMQTGADGDNFAVGGNLAVTGTTTMTGALTANGGVAGNVTGNVTGNLTGNVTGNLTGTSSISTNIAGGGAGQIPYQSALNTTALLAAGTVGYYLKSNGASAPSWAALSALQTSDFTGSNQSLSSSGYQKIPGGLIIQWGYQAISGTSLTFNFPTAFSSACYCVIGTSYYQNDTGGAEAAPVRTLPTTTSVSFSTNSGHDGLFWIAIGV